MRACSQLPSAAAAAYSHRNDVFLPMLLLGAYAGCWVAHDSINHYLNLACLAPRRFYMLMSPSSRPDAPHRLIAVGKKRLPKVRSSYSSGSMQPHTSCTCTLVGFW